MRTDYEYVPTVPVKRAKQVNRRQAKKAWIAGALLGAIGVIVFQLIELIILFR